MSIMKGLPETLFTIGTVAVLPVRSDESELPRRK